MKTLAWQRFGFLILLVLLLVLLFNCSESGTTGKATTGTHSSGTPSAGPSSPEEAKTQEKAMTIEEQWYAIKTLKIKIPESAEGEASLTRNIYFIMDGSGSMNEPTSEDCGGDQRFGSKMAGARWAIRKFMENVPEDVNIGLYIFDLNGKRQVIPLGTKNREDFLQAIEAIDAGGRTPLAEAIKFGTQQLASQYQTQLGYGEFRLVVVTDGIADGIPRAALYAAQHGIPIYTIGLCVGADHPLRNFSVSYRAADSYKDLQEGLEATVAELPSFDVTEFEQ